MSNLTTEQISELHDLALARLSEFDSVAAHFPKLVPGVVRIVVEVYEEWLERETDPQSWPNTPVADDPLADGFHIGYQVAQRKYATRMDGSDHTNGTVNGDLAAGAANADAPVIFPSRDPGPVSFAWTGGDLNDTILPHLTAGELTELAAAYPTMPDLDGADVFAAEHGAPTGEPEADTGLWAGSVNLPADIVGQAFGGDDDDPKPEPEYRIERPSLARYIKPGLTMAQKQTVAEQEAELHEVIATIQTIAVDGQMPSITAYRAARPKHLPEWTTITTRYLIATWRQMAELCGLHYAPAMRAPEPDGDDDDDEPRYRTKPNGKTRKRDTSKPRPDAQRETQPTLAQLVTWLRDNAMGGVMMTQEQFNLARPTHWSTATAHVSRLHTSWEGLRLEAGLKPNPRSAWQQADAVAA